jgi:hypothetical protein
MTSDQELLELIDFARLQGGTVEIQHDARAWAEEGRVLIGTVRIVGLPGIGQHPMAGLSAAEALRRYVGTVLQVTELGVLESVREHMASNVRKSNAQE